MTFHFPCYRNLKNHLGSLDSLAECMELSLRYFIQAARREADVGEFVSAISKTYGIRVDSVDVSDLHTHAAHLYLTGVHQRFEEFLVDFKSEHPNGNNWDFNGDEDRLTKTVRAVRGMHTLEFELCQHYRTVRNAFAHSDVRNKLPDREKPLEKLQAKVQEEEAYNRLEAPNGYWSSTFDDFVLYSRAVKRLAADLSLRGRPTDEELADRARHHVISNGDHARLANNPPRLRGRLVGFLRTEYSLQADEADIIANMVI